MLKDGFLLGLLKRQKGPESINLRKLIDDLYAPWLKEHRRGAPTTLYILTHYFKDFMERNVESITTQEVERWQTQERERGLKASSINRPLTALKSILHWACKRGIIAEYPLKYLEMLRDESDARVRYLSDEERKRLFAAIDERERKLKKHQPGISEEDFADHIKPMILISLNTGIRRGALLALRWSDVDLQKGLLVLRAASAKNARTLYAPMNRTVKRTLYTWKRQTHGADSALVFQYSDGTPISSTHYIWKKLLCTAKIQNFHWHDMRHDFASRLAMSGVDLNTIRELLGHTDLKMTLRYAHLTPQIRQKAVNTLDIDSA